LGKVINAEYGGDNYAEPHGDMYGELDVVPVFLGFVYAYTLDVRINFCLVK